MQNHIKKIFLSTIVFFTLNACSDKPLPIIGPFEIIENSDGTKDTIWKEKVNFELIDQFNKPFSPDSTIGKVLVVDFFFTSCPTICPKMKREMLRIYQKYKHNENILLLSHTIDPKHDTVAVLADYANRLGLENNKWRFLTGNQDSIYHLAQQAYLSFASEDPDAPGGYLHSGAFILVDKQKRIRGVYDGTSSEAVNGLLKDLKILLNE